MQLVTMGGEWKYIHYTLYILFIIRLGYGGVCKRQRMFGEKDRKEFESMNND